MVKFYFVAACVVFTLVLFVQISNARNIPTTSNSADITISDKTPVATAPISGGAAAGVKDEKNFIAYGGVGGFAGVGGYTGVLPTLGGVGGLGGPVGGAGGLGGAGGAGGLGGIGGLGGGVGAVKGGGIGGGIVVP